MKWIPRRIRNCLFLRGLKSNMGTFFGKGFRGMTTAVAKASNANWINPRIRSAHWYPTDWMAAWTTLDSTRPPMPEPEIAMPTARPRRLSNHCWGALIHGNHAKEDPMPDMTPCVMYSCQIWIFLFYALLIKNGKSVRRNAPHTELVILASIMASAESIHAMPIIQRYPILPTRYTYIGPVMLVRPNHSEPIQVRFVISLGYTFLL